MLFIRTGQCLSKMFGEAKGYGFEKENHTRCVAAVGGCGHIDGAGSGHAVHADSVDHVRHTGDGLHPGASAQHDVHRRLHQRAKEH